ncbi:MAG: helix-turn-helix transcriptional regulator [Chloroflexota bacterium]
MKSKWEQIWESLKDPEYRRQFIDEHVNVGIAFQIRSLRNRQRKKQSELAEMLHIRQPLVSSWENPNYGNYSLNTLKDLAKVFDVGLLVRFVPFSSLVDWEVNLVPDMIAPPSFSEEQSQAASKSLNVTSNTETVKDIEKFLSAAEPDQYKFNAEVSPHA